MAVKIARIRWDPRYSVGVAELDDQHRGLFAIMNNIADFYENNQGDALPILQDLVRYSGEHFRAENRLMIKARFPGYADHVKEHEAFTDTLMTFINDYRNQDAKLLERMLLYVRDWLLRHTQQTDMVYAAYIRRMGTQK
ncbi:MAG: bacteriohemerythrin [Syntrophales bacterium]|nr:bacteriohemerythrin [Syntrophales bacterium]